MSANPPLPPGSYRFTVRSADEAVALIRERLGPQARVVSVRAVAPGGLLRWFKAPRLEVIAQVDRPARPETPPAPPMPAARPAAGQARWEQPQMSVNPAQPEGLSRLLRRSGLPETALTRLQARTDWPTLDGLPLHRALAETSRLLRDQVTARQGRPPISRAAFLGPRGAGRSTALCKWIAHEVFQRARHGHVVGVEFDRPNPLGPLPVFSEALGLPLAHFPCATEPAMAGGFAYLDVPAVSPRSPKDNAALAQFLEREDVTDRVLVLNAAYDRASLRDAYAAGRDLGATHLVFTHLDEVPQWGKLWDYLFDETVEPLFLATGPSLSSDCERDVAGAIVRRMLPDEPLEP